jgi:hypothetical protein
MQRLLVYAAFVAVAAGCSSGSSAERTRFLGRADAICRQLGRQVNAIPLPRGRANLRGGDRGEAWYAHSDAAYRLGRELGLRTCAITVRYRE